QDRVMTCLTLPPIHTAITTAGDFTCGTFAYPCSAFLFPMREVANQSPLAPATRINAGSLSKPARAPGRSRSHVQSLDDLGHVVTGRDPPRGDVVELRVAESRGVRQRFIDAVADIDET